VLIFFLICLLVTPALSVDIIVDAAAGRRPISPYIFGRNNSLSDSPGSPLSATQWQLLRDAGVRLFREGGGNNSTKYNWRRKLSSHPDWYNNVYPHDWDFAAASLQQNIPGAKGMWSFQLIGYAAATSANNFDDWGYNNSQWWEGVRNNWAGGGGPNSGDGNPDLYLETWPPDSTVGILDRWFGPQGLGLDKTGFEYWSMDNEPEIWNGTHDDVMPTLISAEQFMQVYFQTTKLAREKFPEIKLVGPVAANEWQWYNWNNNKVFSDGRSYTWLEYFIKRVGEEQNASGVRLLDVLDIHFYPGESNAADIVQLHRVWFDNSYTYPGANGVKRSGLGEWDDSIRREYIFARCRTWLNQYLGQDHGVTFSVSEMGINGNDPDVTAVWYASTLGVFADEGVEIFTPWTWKTGMWEVLHLFSRYAQEIRVATSSPPNATVSAYASLNQTSDSLTVLLVNRDLAQAQSATINLSNFDIADGPYTSLALSDLPGSETFKSHTDNALATGDVSVTNASFDIILPPLSVTAVLLSGDGAVGVAEHQPLSYELALDVYPNPFNPATTIRFELPEAQLVRLQLLDVRGRHVATLLDGERPAGPHTIELDGAGLASGIYVVRLSAGRQSERRRITLLK
jgi:hypothetical protein